MLILVVLGWLRGGAGALRDSGDPDDGGGRCEPPEPRAGEPCNERSRIINRMKSGIAHRGIRGFKEHLRKALERLAGLPPA
jgi:transposase